jgi:hypothetical protein
MQQELDYEPQGAWMAELKGYTKQIDTAAVQEELRNKVLEGEIRTYVQGLIVTGQRLMIACLIALLGTMVTVGVLYTGISRDIERLQEYHEHE